MTITKQKMLLVLNRRIRSLEVQDPNHTRMAAEGMSYAQRRAALATTGGQQSMHADEIETLEAVVKIIEALDEEPAKPIEAVAADG